MTIATAESDRRAAPFVARRCGRRGITQAQPAHGVAQVASGGPGELRRRAEGACEPHGLRNPRPAPCALLLTAPAVAIGLVVVILLGWIPRLAPLASCKCVIGPDILDEIHWRESRRGADPRAQRGVVGPAGEEGPYQFTPICIDDVERITALTGEAWRPNPYNLHDCRRAATIWLEYYCPRVGAVKLEDQYQLYRRGSKGYREWKGNR